MEEKIILNVDLKGGQDVENLDKGLDKLGTTTKRTLSEFQKLSREVREAKGEMLKHAEGTAEYNRALLKASDAQRKLKETNDIVKAGVRDLGDTTKLVAGTVTGLASGFQVAQGAMALFGIENEAVLETMMKMQAVMSITQGIAGFANGIDNLQDLMVGFRAEAKGAGDAVNELSKVSGEASGNMANVAKEGAVIGSNLAGVSVVADGSAKAISKVGEESGRAAQKMVSLFDSGGLLEGAGEKITKSFIDADIALIKSGKEFDSLSAAGNRYLNSLDKMPEGEAAIIKALEDKSKALGEVKVKTEDTTTVTKDLGKNTKELGETTKTATGSMMKSMATMGMWIAIIAAVTYGISKLIEWLNEIPKELEIKLELNTDSLKATQKIKEDIKEIQHQQNMANKARLDGDNKTSAKIISNLKKQLDTIKDGASKEYELAKNKDKWLTEFAKAENERQRKLAYNKALWSKQAETEIIIAQEKQNQKLILESVKTQMKIAANRPGIQIDPDKLTEDFAKGKMSGFDALMYGLSGEVKLWNESVDKLKETREKNVALLSLKPYDAVDFDKTKPTGGSGGTKTTFKPDDLKSDPEYVKAEVIARNNIEWEEWSLQQKSNYQNAEEKILQESIDKRLNIFDRLRNDIILTSASISDLDNEYAAQEEILGNSIQKYKDFNEVLKEQVIANDNLQQSENRKAGLANQLIDLTDKLKEATNAYSKSKNTEEADANAKVVKGIEALIKAKKDEISANDKTIESNKAEITAIEDKLALLKEGTAEYEDAFARLQELEVERLRLMAQNAQTERDIWDERIAMAMEYMNALSSLASGFADISQGNMDLINAEYDRQVWAENEKVQSATAREDALHNLDIQRWEDLQKDFEAQKKWKEAQAWMDFASGSVGIWSGVNAKTGVPGIILSGIQQAALLATTIGNVKSIRAQQMLKPQKGGGSSAGGGNAPALNPHKEALTSRDENLNKMSRGNIDGMKQPIVKVSDINDIQNKVDVRDKNATM